MNQNESVIVVLPLPPKVLSPNCQIGSIGGRYAKAAAAKKQRRLACEAVQGSQVSTFPWNRVMVIPTFFFATNRIRDTDNAIGSIKAAYDGLVDAGTVVNDDRTHMRRKEPVFKIDKTYPRLELRLERLK